MQYLEKDYQRRQLFFHYEKKRLLLKAIFSNTEIPLNIRLKAQIVLGQLPRDANKVRIRNRCYKNKKSRAVFHKYGLNRISFRASVQKGKIPGCTGYS
jgi:small subunit ribosomal protein S14